jgi:hypothetical protein
MLRRQFFVRNSSALRSLNHSRSYLSTQEGINPPNTLPIQPLPKWLQTFNENILLYPKIAMPLFFGMRMGSWYLLAYGCSQVLDLGPELAVGYAVSKFTAKLRQPLNIAMAAVLSHQFPILQQIKVSPLLIFPSTNSQSSEKVPLWLEKLRKWSEGPIDKYGSALLLSGRINSMLTIISVSCCTYYGVDLNSFLSSLGISETLQGASGSFAAASLMNSLLLPLHMWLASEYSSKVSSVLKLNSVS